MLKPFKKSKKAAKPVWPITAPGMAYCGPALLALASARGSSVMTTGTKAKRRLANIDGILRDTICDCLYKPGSVAVNLQVGTSKVSSQLVSGHRWGDGIEQVNGIPQFQPSTGPKPCKVMLVNKCMTELDMSLWRHMSDAETLSLFISTLRKYDYTGEADWYVTSALKTIVPEEKGGLKPAWISECEHLFHQELRLVKPDYILCVGADALKLVLGKKATLEKARGTVQELVVDMRKHSTDAPNNHTIKVMACEHPRSVLRDDRKRPRFELDVARFIKLLDGVVPDTKEKGLKHYVIDNEIALRKVLKIAEASNPSRIVAVDAEWHKQHPQNEGAYLRCVQFSWAHKCAACVALHSAGGKPAFRYLVRDANGKPIRRNKKLVWTTRNGLQFAFKLLRRYFQNKRVTGHFLNADLEWLVYFGLDLRAQFAAASDWTKCKTEGGLDTAFMAHAVEETAIFNLTDQHLRFTKAPRYDVSLELWKAKYCQKNKLKASQLEGYGECPDKILYPYANYDADVTRRLVVYYMKKLDCDAYGNNCWEAFWLTQRAAAAALEMTCTGLLVNRQRLDRLTTVYMQARDKLVGKIKAWARWPGLNLKSAQHIRELLFGEKYNDPDADGKVRRIRPRGALSLYAMPAITTDKRPKPWESIIGKPQEAKSKPSTNRAALGILFREAKTMRVFSKAADRWITKDCGNYIADIRNYRFINQTLQSVLAVPVEDEAAELFDDPFETDEDGNYVYDVRLPGAICTDNRVRTFLSLLKETGRWASYRPPLMNLGKRRETDYKLILGDSYEYPLRSIFEADPGYTLVEADYIGAELFGMAILSGDKTMIEHALRNQLPEDHPDYFDIHSYVARLAFGLECEPTKAGLAALGKAHLRIVAKSVIFGVAYGRGAKAVALAVREEGVSISVDEAQAVIDTIFTTYPRLVPFFAECRARAVSRNPAKPSPRFLCGVFGRMRRFPFTTDKELMSDFERQAMNFPLQNMVADAVSTAVHNLRMYRQEHSLNFKFALQIHDALLFLVPNQEVPLFIDKVLPECMIKRVPIYPCHLDGRPKKNSKVYNLGIDCEVYRYWGVGMSPKDCQERRVPERYAGWHKSELFPDGWESHKQPKHVWLSKTEKSHPYLVSKNTGKALLKEEVYKQAVELGKLPQSEQPLKKALAAIKDDELLALMGL